MSTALIVWVIVDLVCIHLNTLVVWARLRRLMRAYSWGHHVVIGVTLLHYVLALAPNMRLRWVAIAILITVILLSSNGGGRFLKKAREKASAMMTEIQAGAFQRETAVARS